jgi:hypothetical protein
MVTRLHGHPAAWSPGCMVTWLHGALHRTLRSVESDAVCPYCFEPVSLWIDLGGGFEQDYIEDCAICCRPCRVIVSEGADGQPVVTLTRE